MGRARGPPRGPQTLTQEPQLHTQACLCLLGWLGPSESVPTIWKHGKRCSQQSNEVTQDHTREAHVGCPLLPVGCHVWDPGVHPQRLLGSSLQCCSDQPLWEGGEVRKQETVINPAGLQQSHLVSLQLGPPYSGGLGSAQLSTPPLPAWAGPSSHACVGCGVSAPWPCPASGGRGAGRTHTSAAVRDAFCLVGSEGSAACGLHPGCIPSLLADPEEAPTVQNTSRCPSHPCPMFSPYSVPGMPAPDLEGWIPGLPCHLASDWVGQWEAGSESRGRRSGRIGCSFPGSCLCLCQVTPVPCMASRGRGEVLLWAAWSPNPAHVTANSSLLTILLYGLARACYLFSEAGDQYPFCLHELTLRCKGGQGGRWPCFFRGKSRKVSSRKRPLK